MWNEIEDEKEIKMTKERWGYTGAGRGGCEFILGTSQDSKLISL